MIMSKFLVHEPFLTKRQLKVDNVWALSGKVSEFGKNFNILG